MILSEFIFSAALRQKTARNTIHLECKRCGETEERDLLNLYTGHFHDQTCTYVCKVCKGDMKEVV